MSEYTVTIRIANREEFMHFIDTVGVATENIVVSVKASDGQAAAPREEMTFKPTSKAHRGPGRSKVNDTILTAMASGPQTIKQLKEALVTAGMAAGSLSTGLATLQKTNQVERVGEGLYGRTFAKAAE